MLVQLHLLLLQLQRDELSLAPGLEEELPLAFGAERADREEIQVAEVEGLGHDGANVVRSSPVEFTVRTTGPSAV